MADKQFCDIVKITIKSGNGGDGMNSFKSYKGKPACGPDGGDGGDGGNVYVRASESVSDLLSFRYVSKYTAGDGERGGSNKCFGKSGADVILDVPVGTVVRDFETGSVIADMFGAGEVKLIAEGGRGGKGNVRFTTSRRHAPNFAQKGEKTKPHTVVLELKIIADVGIIGFPNVGKSTLLSKISAARPKIANYHFTTLSPNLGVVRHYQSSFVAADIPGLIEGASQGAGLGHDFLRHIERTRMLLHIVDISGVEGRDPLEDFLKINAELKSYSAELASRPQVVALNKCDVFGADRNVQKFIKTYGEQYKIYPVSAVDGGGLTELLNGVCQTLESLPPVRRVECDQTFTYREGGPLDFEIFNDNGVYVVVGTLVDMLCRNVVLSDPESMAYFQKVLRDKGVIHSLTKMGVKEGDTVEIGDVSFEFIP